MVNYCTRGGGRYKPRRKVRKDWERNQRRDVEGSYALTETVLQPEQKQPANTTAIRSDAVDLATFYLQLTRSSRMSNAIYFNMVSVCTQKSF